jgi:hypothetical protein
MRTEDKRDAGKTAHMSQTRRAPFAWLLPECVAALCALAMAPGPTAAQDSHYWTNQYGTQATLLGGAVIGSIIDLSSAYYNPGTLALIDDTKFIIGKAFQFSSVTLENGAGDGLDLSSSAVRPIPDLIAGLVNAGWLKQHRLSYSLLTRYRFDVEVAGRRIDSRDVIARATGVESFAGEVTFNQNLTEVWAGLTWSYPLSQRIGIGVTQYLTIRSQSSRSQVIAQALTGSDELAAAINIQGFDYRTYGALWKAGLSFDLTPFALGLTVTTPTLRLLGSGAIGVNETVVGQDVDGDGNVDPLFAADFQDGVDATYKSPLSIGFGASYRMPKTAIHASAEWFGEVDEFEALKAPDFTEQVSGQISPNELTHRLQSVVNVGAGIEHEFKSGFMGYGSFIADFSAADSVPQRDLSLSDWDIYQFSAGTRLQVNRSEVTLGLAYAFGRKEAQRRVDFSGASEENQLRGELSDARFKYTALKFILGFAFPF